MFEHFLITRFNLTNPDWTTTKNNELLLNDSWMEQRIWLFKSFCLPSVVNQTNKNFTWLIFADTATKSDYKTILNDLVKDHDFIRLEYIDGMAKFQSSINAIVSKMSQGKNHIISTRIDNDDAIHKDFISEIQSQFNSQKYLVIDVIKGYSLQIKPQIMLGKKEHIFNPFLSLIEENSNPKTIWHNSHTDWKNETRIKYYTKKRLWIAIIHDKNKINNFNGYGNISWKNLSKEFILSDEMSNTILNNAIDKSQWRKLSLKNRIIVKYKVLSKIFKKSIGVYKLKSK